MRAFRLVTAVMALPLISAQVDPAAVPARTVAEARRGAAAAMERARALDTAAEAATDAARAARIRREAVAARVEAKAADIAAVEAERRLILNRLAFARARLADRQRPTAELLAALQSLARRPAIAAVAQPGTTADLVHLRAALASVMPQVTERSRAVQAEVAETERLERRAAGSARELVSARAALEQERVALARAESEARLRATTLARTALVESDRAIALGEAARDIVDRMAVEAAAADTMGSLAALDGPMPRPGDPGGMPGASPYRLPVAGRVVTGMGEVSDNGVRARGVTLAPRPGASVVAPGAGRVLFARPFRSYGRVVIIAHGDGWSTLVSGLSATAVRRGEEVAAGQRIGLAGPAEPRITVELRRRGRPIDVAALIG